MEVFSGVSIGDRVSLSLYLEFRAVVPTDFSNVVVAGLTNWRGVTQYVDAATQHANLYPGKPDTLVIPDDYQAYNYVILELSDGQRTAIGYPFINSQTVTLHEPTIVNVKLDGVSPEDHARITTTMSAIGFTVMSIE